MTAAAPVALPLAGPAGERRPRVAAIIVSYHPAAILRDSVAAVRPQVEDLVIVDNGSACVELLEEIAATFACDLVLCRTNAGVAAALNRGMEHARRKGCEFALLLDQDSCVTGAFVEAMLSTYASVASTAPGNAAGFTGGSAVGMVAPTYLDRRSGASMHLTSLGSGVVLTTMTSGTLLPMTTYLRCGGFEEAFFIDYVDMEYCLRLQRSGLSIVQSQAATLLHSLGSESVHRMAGITFHATNHSASRRYYISRNRAILYARYAWTRPAWVARDLGAMLTETLKILLVEGDRTAKMRGTCRGVIDALLGRTGYKAAL